MVNTVTSSTLRRLGFLVGIYIAVVVGTIAALGIMSSVAPSLATKEAWGHAVIVAVFATLLGFRLRSARQGKVRALRAVGIIAAVLLLVNVVQALIPGLYPAWMRVEMVAIAALMGAVVAVVAVDRA